MANHAKNLDPIFVAACTKRQIFFLMKIELFKYKWSAWLMGLLGGIPVHRDGTDFIGLKKALAVLREEKVIGIFPEGMRIRKKEDELKFKPGAAMIAYRTDTPIVPVFISGTYRLFSRMTVLVGKPFKLDAEKGKLSSDDYQRLTDEQLSPKLAELRDQIGRGVSICI
jgi:1-acyl-sn-glycerol-3-phosphate acyltransferase